jgi:hypothetical protein
MATKEAFTNGPSAGPVNRGGQRKSARVFSRPKPEDGRRLVRVFMDVKSAPMREAIIKFITELSRLPDES